MSVIRERVDRLEEALMRLVYIQQKTEIELQNFKEEMKAFREGINEYKEWSKKHIENIQKEIKDFKEEMNEFKNWSKQHIEKSERETQAFVEWSKKQIDSLNQAWGNLANRMGTLVEDIFAPSIDIALSKYFQAVPDVIDTRKKVRINGSSLEIDILAVERKKKRAFIVEIKGSPDRGEYVESFLEKLERVPRFLPELADFQRIGIYAALSMQEETVKLLTRKGLYAMVFRGNVLEIVNFQDLQESRSS